MKLLEMFSPSSRQKLMEGIDHPEDLIIQQGSKGADRVIQDLSKLETDPSTITIKWDGLPALVWGRDKDGNFQLVDKHQFEKIAKGKAEFSTIKDYDEARGANRSSLWAKEDILRPVLDAATPQVRDQYWFGDFMFAGTPPTKDGKFIFKPNTVEYRVSQDGELGDKISESQAGMAVHTFIPGLGSDDQPLVGLKGLDENAGVVFFVGEIKDKPTIKVDNNILAKAQSVVNEHRAAVDKFLADLTEMKAKSVVTAMSPFITRMLEEDDISGNIVPRFLEFLPERLTPAAAEKMLGKNKDGWLYQADGGGPGLLGIWSMWAAVTELKTSIKQLLDSQMQGSEVQALTDGIDAHEGYVFGAGKDKLKLIDRLGFTKANFARYRISDDEKKAKADMPMAAFCFGRMNPPTLGHGLVMEKTVEVGGKDAYIFLSNSQGKDDPLDPSTKAQFIKKMYPKLSSHIVDDYVQGPIYAANWLYDRGFRNITFVGGSDRLGKAPGSIEKLLNSWNSGPVRTTDAARGDSGREYVNLNFVSSGERDPDAPGVSGYSGTKARQAAADGDEAKFWEYTGASPNLKVGAVDLYQATRAGMGIKDAPAQEGMESMLDEGKFRKRDIEEKLISNDKLNDLKSKYLPDWEMLDHRILQAKYVAKDHRHAEDFVSYINKISEEMDHFAEVTQDVAEVTVKTTTFDVKGLTILDFKLALKVDKFADNNEIEQVRMQGNFGMHENVNEAPIELDREDPMDPMIYGYQSANPAKLKYRMSRAAGQLKDLASRVDNASPSEWQTMARQFEELKMNMEQIRHALEELGKVRKKGGVRSRGIDPMLDSIDEGCQYGRYYCSTDKKWKCRTGPKQKRSS
jgi:pterin-4a-carbinolamine dehydratase